MATAKEEKTVKTKEEYMKEKVPVMIIAPEGEKVDFTTVTVNGYNYQIEYGKTVMVPRFVKEVIENSRSESEKARRTANMLAREFEGGK